jgi:Tfp pilus assembly protein PilO
MQFNLSKKQGILLVVAGLLVLAAVSYFLLFVPELRTIRALQGEIAAKEDEVAEALKLRATVAESRTGASETWERRLRTWEVRVPASADTERLLSELGERAVQHKLQAFALTVVGGPGTPGAPPQAAAGAEETGEKGRLRETRFRIAFRSSYRDLAEFLDEIPRMRRLLTVRSVEIKEQSGAMAATVEISAWYRGTS